MNTNDQHKDTQYLKIPPFFLFFYQTLFFKLDFRSTKLPMVKIKRDILNYNR